MSLDPRRRRRLVRAFLIWLAISLTLTTIQRHLRVNTNPSSPPGLYAAVSRPLAHDTWVIACLDEETTRYGRQHGYLPTGNCPGGGRPVLKRVAALPGDRVIVTPTELVTDRLRLRRLQEDFLGRPLRRIAPGHYRVPRGSVWLYSDYSPRSWDSRYWGPVPIKGLRTVVPIWTFP